MRSISIERAPFIREMLYKELLQSHSQVWVGAIARGPNGQQLLGNYHTSEQLTYQDDVGHLVRDVCATIPHGVLCFFPSYKSLEKICNRWKVSQGCLTLQIYSIIITEIHLRFLIVWKLLLNYGNKQSDF